MNFDYQTVTLKGITLPINNSKCSTAEELVSYCARVSNPKNQTNHSTSPKLLSYLIKEHHWSPFEMVNLVMEVKTTRDIARQFLRHRSFSFQEFSQRYAQASTFVIREARLQDTKNRQNSIVTEDEALREWFEEEQKMLLSNIQNVYNQALEKGIAKEQARAVLPEGLTESTLYANGTLRSWMHFCALRMANGTQLEHSDIALKAWNIVLEQFPTLNNEIVMEALRIYANENLNK